jgi:glucose-6-phosphate isomerase
MAAKIGAGGVSEAELAAELKGAAKLLAKIKATRRSEQPPHYLLPTEHDDLPGLEKLAAKLSRNTDDVIVCGTGGSSLGGQTLAQVAGWGLAGQAQLGGSRPRLHFADNLDADSLQMLISAVEFPRTQVLLISKSGNTTETIAQACVLIDAFVAEGLGKWVGAHFTAITEPGDPDTNQLRHLCARHDIKVLDHLPDLGGRYSVLSNVGLLPAALAGLDIAAVRAGAAEVLRDALTAPDPQQAAPALAAAIAVALARKGTTTNVMMAYSDRLERFTRWYVQLWSESLGKNGIGMTPLAARGPVDQHSQLQLFLGGPNDKLYTVVMTGTAGRGPWISAEMATRANAKYLVGHSIGDIVDAMQRATAEALARNGRPVRLLTIDSVDARSVGALVMHFMLETIIAASLLGVDPFDQPAVEESKQLARSHLAGL